MSKIIIGIHGLGNKPPARLLTSWWKTAMEEGLESVSPATPISHFELVYWARLLHLEALNPTIDDEKDPLYIGDPYVRGEENQPPEKPREFRKKILDYLGNQLDDIFLKTDSTINFSSVSDFIIRHFFSDLGVYYQTYHQNHHTPDYQLKPVIRALLAETLRKHRRKKILLIAHSMGSIIAYDVLTQLVPEVKIDTLITIGSPLGLPIIRGKIAAELSKTDKKPVVLRTPENVTTNWFNLADTRDKIALYDQLGGLYAPNSSGIQVIDQTVHNNYTYQGEKNPHKAYGYLRTPEIAAIIHGFLQRKPFALLEWIRRRLRFLHPN
ncbi:MAG: alpha/beta hydrolase [Proteobacteria bacterium]|nr:alpha/beta hydrolase [Pseudomonadota bacterium]